MIKYSTKRLLQSIVTVLLIATIVFLLMRMLPTDYYFTEEQLMKFTEAQKDEQLLAAGLLDPIPKQLVDFYGKLARFDFGESRRIQNGVPVVKIISTRFAISMKLGITALGISLITGVTMGTIQSRFKDKLGDHIGTAYTIFANAVPPLVSYSLVLILGTRLLNLPSMYSTRNPGPSSILPVICLCISSIAWWALWTRRYMVDEINKDYIKLARIKGMPNKKIMRKHVLRNAFVPLAQYLPASFLSTVSGSILVERFFSIPGMGPLLVDSINRYDLNVVQTVTILYATLGILGVFFGDILMMLIDPRITLTSEGGSR
ncbi:ABC transporter permease [Tissierella praeacuta]|uniref:ABC transporter permease n=1 Tax=Tissierella praeacuta TaxID=43131 RepID=UPI0028AB2424|nr:ABC transporter permease [Tissierella praeacuta]